MRTAAQGELVAHQILAVHVRTASEAVHIVAASVGFLSLAALWLGMLMGTTLRSGWLMSRVRHSTVYGLHANLVLFGIWIGMVHGFAQLAVPNGKVRWIDEGVPFLNQFDRIGIGMGTLALELFVAFTLSVLIQRKLGYHRWRTLHSLAYFAFTIVVAHVLTSGSDIAGTPIRAVIAGGWAVAMLAGLVTFPALSKLPRRMAGRTVGQVRAADVTINVDPTRCVRFGFCEHEAPQIFSLRSDGRLAYRSSVTSDQAEQAMQAALVCPARAITLGKLPTHVVVTGNDGGGSGGGIAAPPAPAPVPMHATGPQNMGPMPGTGPQPGPPPGGFVPDGPPGSLPERPWSPLEDTGRHHVRPLRPPVGRPSGGSRR
jgi:ferredoxin/DMSO/TMAO reductase YedYZ heme-binding membrane subunit